MSLTRPIPKAARPVVESDRNKPYRRVTAIGYFGLCDNCHQNIENVDTATTVSYVEVSVSCWKGRRYYCRVCWPIEEATP